MTENQARDDEQGKESVGVLDKLHAERSAQSKEGFENGEVSEHSVHAKH